MKRLQLFLEQMELKCQNLITIQLICFVQQNREKTSYEYRNRFKRVRRAKEWENCNIYNLSKLFMNENELKDLQKDMQHLVKVMVILN